MTQNQELELEYTFLASELPSEIAGVLPTRLVDIYIPDSATAHAHLRLRQKGDSYEITKKVPISEGDASAQIETTIKLELSEFEAISALSQKRVTKDRYNVEISGYPAEVDVFLGDLAGLILIDFEFANKEDQSQFVKPAVCLADVTQEDFIAGGLLAGKKYSDIAGDLGRFNYTRIDS